jgi:HNH endonuclease
VESAVLSPTQIEARRGKLTGSRIREALDYDPNTGIFRWKMKNPRYRGHVAPRAGSKCNDRRRIRIDGQNHYEHILAWVYMTGEWPTDLLDHRNNVGSDNRWENIRKADRRLNRANSKVSKNSIVGLKGVSQLPSGRFQARLASRYLGSFDTKEQAHAAYMCAAVEAFDEFARPA